MKCVVTGGAGFIGSHLIDSLSTDGIPVRALVKPGGDLANLKNSRAEIVPADLRDPSALTAAMEGWEVVYHLAAISLYDARVPDEEYRRINVEGTGNVLEAARRSGVRRVVFTGTIEAVGMSTDRRPLTEDTPQSPRNIYGRTKLEAERLVRSYRAEPGPDTVVVRPPMTYGPRELILWRRLFGIIRRGFYPLVGAGRVLTEFCYVKNLVWGIRLAAQKGRAGEVYFISDERSYTIEEIVGTIARELKVSVMTPRLPIPFARGLGLTFEILSRLFPFYPFVIPQTGRPPFSRKTVEWTSASRLFCDISKAKRELGYRPPYTLAEGVRETVQWYREQGFLR